MQDIRRSLFDNEEETQMILTLKEQINIDRNLEDLKNQLAYRSDFNLLDCFRIFDGKSTGYLTKP